MLKKITVIGAGLMGSGIAQVAAEAGFSVTINDAVPEALEKGINGIISRWNSKASKGKINEEKLEMFKNCLKGEEDFEKAAADADLVIEAATEKMEIKKVIFANLSKICRKDTIIASNTSSLSLTELASNIDIPERFIGTHFFSPVPAMKLLEVIPGLLTSGETIDKTLEFGEKIGKVTIMAKDAPGFIVNRLVDPMMNDAIKMLDNGIGTVEAIDNGMKFGCGHPMGPLELADMAGVDVLYYAMKGFYDYSNDPFFAPATLLKKMVLSGFLGKKVGKGFYIYNEDGTKYPNPAINKL